ncbi:glycoside hydrolase family 13 protein [Pseudarthrobacter sulfonivorans]|uniref:glycoside hydrolase family 13 protein n=1 Tax=Pseudarthrobacter sulfonivorans TaxID=121292 RepID=UPI00285DD2DD|nr:glycoside hydrolase family 13 protein [Pseudarthrobacter sulfonivorans]MDR6415296.1 alpha-glucosidase [Pseudarthrobacter sulfonivorans]
MIEMLLENHNIREAKTDWWKDAVVYQIYPRSFADANGDGMGDLPGVTSKLAYLQDLGVDAIWMSPFYPSPLADGGYDVSDYCGVDTRLGTLEDFEVLVESAHRRGLKVIIDIVPNHTSSEHPWFRKALASPPGSPERDRYIFRDGKGGQPPTDWQSHFGGSAWEQVADGQWYCHLFDKGQPDLNWGNGEVRAYFLSVLRFWADRGVDGFRVDVAHSLVKDLSEPLRDQPKLDRALPLDGSDPLYDRDGVHEVYRSWREVFNEYDPPLMAVAETWSPANSRTFLYARPDELGQVFDFSLLKSSWSRDSYRDTIKASLAGQHSIAGHAGSNTWVLSSHDVPRHASRLALPAEASADDWLLSDGLHPVIDEDCGQRRASAATLMMLALPGSAYLYQGEELGLREVSELRRETLQDPVWHRSGGTVKGRDGCRVPLPWTKGGPSFGFGSKPAWLEQPDDWADRSVEAQVNDPGSMLSFYKLALQHRRNLPALRSGEFAWETGAPELLVFTRSPAFMCAVNFAPYPVPFEAPGGSRVVLSSGPVDGQYLAPESAVWLILDSAADLPRHPGDVPS